MAKEYIELEAITKLAKEIKDDFAPLHRAVIDAFVYSIKTNIPTADVVEVVRCKDCAVPHNRWLGCPNLNGLIPPLDFYCERGERKE